MENYRLSMVARFPLLVYFGLVLGFFVFALSVLTIDIGFQPSWEYLVSFIKDNPLATSAFLVGILILVFTVSSLTYKEELNLSSEDYALWREQRATRTLFPLLLPLHDKLRLKFKLYRKWHTGLIVSSLHYLLLIIFSSVIISNFTFSSGKILLAEGPEFDPPSDAPIMNAPSDITNNSIRWNITDNTTTEDDHTFQRTDHFIVGAVVSTTKATTGTSYSYNETSLSPNASYTRHAHATNSQGEGEASLNASTVTLANIPGTLTFLSVSSTTIKILINPNGNPGSTNFAIQETSTGKFVQGDGALSSPTAWGTYGSWGGDSGKIVTGLSPNVNYTFRVKARNSNSIETVYSASVSKNTLAKTPTSPALTVVSTTSISIVINENGNSSTVEYVIFNETSGKYVKSNGTLSTSPEWHTKINYGGVGGVLNAGLSENTSYTYKVKARNNDNIETNYSVGNTVSTGSPGSSSGGGEGGGESGGGSSGGNESGGGSTNNTNNQQYTVEINVLDADPDSGVYRVGIDYITGGGTLIGNLEGVLTGDIVTGSFVGEFAGNSVSGAFNGEVVNGILVEATIILTRKDDTDYRETLRVKGVFERTKKGNLVTGQIGDEPNDTINTAVVALALITAFAAIPAIVGPIVTRAISGLGPLQWLFLGYVPRRRKRVWGRVLNSDTHMPVAGVRVELTDLKDNKILKRLMTDKTGRYGFLVENPGTYVVAIHNPLYHNYQSQVITINHPKLEIVGHDILLKPNEAEVGKRVIKTAKLIQLFKIIAYLHWPLLIGGTVLSVYLEFIEPSTLRLAIVSIYAILWIFEISQLARKHSYGTVVDKESEEEQSQAIVQLVRDKGGVNSIAATTITDKHGRFFFVVKRASYNLSATKGGFIPTIISFNGETPETKIELQSNKESSTKT